jgi:hypothetical protein
MKNTLTLLILTSLFLSMNLSANERFVADNAKTKLEWLGEKVLGQHTGTINLQSGWLTWTEIR